MRARHGADAAVDHLRQRGAEVGGIIDTMDWIDGERVAGPMVHFTRQQLLLGDGGFELLGAIAARGASSSSLMRASSCVLR